MTDTELNEKIARLMGWIPLSGEPGCDWLNPDGTEMSLPDFLAPECLVELMDLADRIFDDWWKLESKTIFPERKAERFVTVESETAYANGPNFSLALVRAIVGYAESENDPKGLPQSRKDGQVCGEQP